MNYSEFEVEGLPKLEFNITGLFDMHAGEIPITDSGSTLFFWDFISPKRINERRPLVIWLNGGPGCSSMDGALMEIGPIRIENDLLRFNKGWFELADLLFIDQPLATGFSHLNNDDSLVTDLDLSTKNLMTFLEKYFNMIESSSSSNLKFNDIIIGGESYAGQYIPHLAKSIKNSKWGSEKIKAITMGNAWIDPNLQSLSFIPFSIINGLINPEKDNEKLAYLLTKQDKCQNIQNNNKDIEFIDQTCDGILSNLLSVFRPEPKKCINVYDISKIDSYPSCGNNWPETIGDVTKYLNIPEVQNALNIKNSNKKKWNECNNNIFRAFKPSNDQLSANLLTNLLQDGIKIQLFSGVNDLICNYLSTEMVLNHHLSEFIKSPNIKDDDYDYDDYYGEIDENYKRGGIETMDMELIWKHGDEIAGEASIWGNLSYIKVNKASHMVAYDLSERSIGLLELLIIEDDQIDIQNKTLITGQFHKEMNNLNETSILKRYISLFVLLFVFLTLGGYLVKCILKDKNYSILSNGENGAQQKKKRVHWRDLEHLGDENINEFEMVDITNNNNDDDDYVINS